MKVEEIELGHMYAGVHGRVYTVLGYDEECFFIINPWGGDGIRVPKANFAEMVEKDLTAGDR